jgi:hypothetical protein
VGQASSAGNLPALNGSFRRTLRAEDKSERTVKSYTEAVRLFADFLAERGHPLTVEAVTRDDVRAFVADQLERWRPLTALNRYRGLQAFFKWAVAEGELAASPMAGMNPPQIPDEPPPVLTDEELRRLLKACEGRDFTDRRDAAILRLFLDTAGPEHLRQQRRQPAGGAGRQQHGGDQQPERQPRRHQGQPGSQAWAAPAHHSPSSSSGVHAPTIARHRSETVTGIRYRRGTGAAHLARERLRGSSTPRKGP